ncbi:hypothetical protein [Paludisphaera soli]|uniref:hypothetical protein n=1 Tax=Paludisphaera soli TaxID=2712865 RepID=UPI0013EC89D6|nr:hypothetical protein [Paludisphaera soli]
MTARRMTAAAWVAVMAAGLLGVEARAGLVQVLSRADLAGNDLIDWGTLGSNGDLVSNPVEATSAGGLRATVSKRAANGDFQVLVQGATNGWAGNFSPGETVLWTNNYPDAAPNAITMDFASGVAGVGMNFQQANALATFTAEMAAFDAAGGLLGVFSATGASNANNDGSAVFLGLKSTEANIHRVVFYLTAAPFNYIGSYGVNQVSLLRPAAAVPEPSAIVSAALGALLIAGGRLVARGRRAG